ncbi:excisionase [Grimontia sp. NTOU-MAR1]|uniref:excisionase n=1 Tax=Grimontia sp. NTOU-MAR1 TaxID=3111011 RepID=UPI002DBD3876|nr:excisionase [Grimontia sp. NTOU-MAR1]WRV98337.1 excisionase [Grimontia sp. NTOU-MAR1]
MSNYHFIRLSDWAATVFLGEHYSAATMGRWVKTRQINPPPVKVGGRWMVRTDAQFIGLSMAAQGPFSDPLVERIMSHGR